MNTNFKFIALLASDDPVRKQWIEHEKKKFADKMKMEERAKEPGTKETHDIEVVAVSNVSPNVSPSTISMLSDNDGVHETFENEASKIVKGLFFTTLLMSTKVVRTLGKR